MFTRRAAMISAAAAALLLASPAFADTLNLPREKVNLVAPPFVHPHEQATKQGPKIMEFRLVVEEKKVVVDEEGTTFQAMTFNGSMPGPLMVVHEGDYVELTLVNPATNTMPKDNPFTGLMTTREEAADDRLGNDMIPGQAMTPSARRAARWAQA